MFIILFDEIFIQDGQYVYIWFLLHVCYFIWSSEYFKIL